MNRHRFEPARLLTGLLLCGTATAYLLDAVGAADLHPLLLALLIPATLALGALVATVTLAARGTRARRTRARSRARSRVAGADGQRGRSWS